MPICPRCKGEGDILVKTHHDGGETKKFKIKCRTCDGKGSISKEEQAEDEAWQKIWCLCGDDFRFGSYPENGECDCGQNMVMSRWHCPYCRQAFLKERGL